MSSKNIKPLLQRVKQHPDDLFSKFALALELIKVQKQKEAVLLFEDIIRRDPEYVGVYYHLGGQYQLQNENKKAISTYKQGIEVAERLRDVHAKSELATALLTLQLETES
ncbi:MAG: tetratricopeptide repeat protein [bacterium]|nr:tetratricopeptide repeat protein [bacterium]